MSSSAAPASTTVAPRVAPRVAPPALALTALHYRWPGAQLDTLSIDALSIACGEAVFLHGPSGSGKSTLLGLFAGVLLPTAGRLQVLGQEWQSWSGPRRDAFRADHIGVLFQQFNLLPYLSVLDNVTLPLGFSAHRASKAIAADAERLLAQMDLPTALWRRRAAELSVGQQQRVAAARCLLGTPSLVIADEPTSALDHDQRDRFVDLLLGQCRQVGSTVVFVSHDQSLAARFDRSIALTALQRESAAA